MQEFNKKHDDADAAKLLGENKTQHKSAITRVETKREQDQGETDFAYTIAAARRSEQRRLLAYVRMSDYMVCDTLHTVLLETCRELLEVVRHVPPGQEVGSRGVHAACTAAHCHGWVEQPQPKVTILQCCTTLEMSVSVHWSICRMSTGRQQATPISMVRRARRPASAHPHPPSKRHVHYSRWSCCWMTRTATCSMIPHQRTTRSAWQRWGP